MAFVIRLAGGYFLMDGILRFPGEYRTRKLTDAARFNTSEAAYAFIDRNEMRHDWLHGTEVVEVTPEQLADACKNEISDLV